MTKQELIDDMRPKLRQAIQKVIDEMADGLSECEGFDGHWYCTDDARHMANAAMSVFETSIDSQKYCRDSMRENGMLLDE